MAINGTYYTPHKGDDYKKLDNSAIIGHLNQKYAVGIFSAKHGSKFICFDVDLPDPEVVHRVIHGLCLFGFPKEQIYVSSSGGKGYHVEMFFTNLVYLNLLHDLYLWVLQKEGLDKKKVEFRPTYTQAIKLPLGKHHKTGNICWYLDRDTLAPIEDQGYVMKIIPMDRDRVEKMIQAKLASEGISSGFFNEPHSSEPCLSEPCSKDEAQIEYSDDPMMTAPGTRHSMMKYIAVRERYKDTPQEEIEEKLKDWASKQNPDFITDPWGVVMYDAEHLAHDVWKPTFVVKDRVLIITKGDIQDILSCHASLQKQILFLILLYTRRYGTACLSAARIARHMKCSPLGVQKALVSLGEKGLISKSPGKTVYSKGKFVAGANVYKFRPSLGGDVGTTISVDWNFKEDTFKGVYLKTMRDNVSREDWKKYFTKKEMEELQNADCN